MDIYSGGMWIVGALGTVLMIGMFRSRLEWILNFLLRGILGMLLIYFGNLFLAEYLPENGPGYNLLTFLVCGFLGVPGVFLLYGILLYMHFF